MKDSQTFNLAQLSWAELTQWPYAIAKPEIERRHEQADVLRMRRLGHTKGYFGEALPIHPPMDHDYYPHH